MNKYTGKLPILPSRGYFQKNDKGDQVRLMQAFLIWLGFSCGRTGADGIFGVNTDKAVRAYQKKYKLKIDGLFGKYSLEKAKSFLATRQDKICIWASKIAASKAFKYKKWSGRDKKTQQCPICHHLTGQYKGWNCIGFAFAAWRHGGAIPCNCDCGVISNEVWEQILKAKTDADATKIIQKYTGVSAIKVIRNKNGIPASSLKPGDIISYFNGTSYFHTALYVGNSKTADSDSGSNPNIQYGRRYVPGKSKVAIRYLG